MARFRHPHLVFEYVGLLGDVKERLLSVSHLFQHLLQMVQPILVHFLVCLQLNFGSDIKMVLQVQKVFLDT